MKLNKEKFLKTELGSGMQECLTAWDKWLAAGDRKAALWCQAQWEVYKMAGQRKSKKAGNTGQAFSGGA